jgi:serine/threonine protein kinase/tetratricopeptide (TPR) repeat protein
LKCRQPRAHHQDGGTVDFTLVRAGRLTMNTAQRSGQVVSHYQIDELLGSGGMGEVYRGTDLRLGRPVALKFVRPFADPAMRDRLIQEARAAALLDHPNICTIYEVDETEAGEVFIAMAYYEGETLDRILARGPLSAERALAMVVQVARGLAAAHEELIVHRDIKPANLMVTRNDTVKILDFGVAVLMKDRASTDAGSVPGTPAYMSPEQLCGRPVDARADIWSLGTVLYEMVTGRRPFVADSLDGVIDAVLNDEPVRPSDVRADVPPRAEQIIARALAKDARFRYERTGELIQDLVEALATIDPEAITASLPVATPRRSLAVLPFADMTATGDQEYLCDGIAEEILRAVSRIPDLHVASRTSSFQFRNRSADVREIGAHLGVETILEGSVRRVGDRVRVSAQLVNVRDGYRIWSERYEREMRDIFAIEDEIADQIARALEVELDAGAAVARAGRGAPYSEADELYLQGRQFVHQHRRKAFEVALQLFARAIEVNPRFGRAYAGIANCHCFLHMYFRTGEESVVAADAASRKAIELEPDLSDSHVARGFALFLQDEYDRAEVHLRRAIELDPRQYDSRYISGRLCFSQGRMKEALGHFRAACAIVPEAYDCWYLLGMCYRRLGDEARGRNADFECIEAAKRRVRGHPDDTRAWTMGAAVLAELGEDDNALKWLGHALAVDPDEPLILYNAACVNVRLGRTEAALDFLEQAFGAGAFPAWIANDPDLDPVRTHPRFQKLLGQPSSKPVEDRPGGVVPANKEDVGAAGTRQV